MLKVWKLHMCKGRCYIRVDMFNGAQHFQVLATEGFSGVAACLECSFV